MRELKFRAWDKKSKEMFAVHELKFAEEKGKAGNLELIRGYNSNGCTSFEGKDVFGGYNVKRFELMQYTGQKDNNGVAIYQKDIIGGKGNGRYGIVDWSEKRLAWVVTYIGNGEFGDESIEVIGNIYENPDLLKGGDTP